MGQIAVGECHHRAKLSARQVAMIRAKVREGLSYRRVAVLFCISAAHVFNIVKFKQRNDINGVKCSLHYLYPR